MMAPNVNESAGGRREKEQCGFQIGCGRCKTARFPVSCLNIFNNSRWALLFLCINSFLQGAIVNGITSVVISTLERRFHLRSSETGFMAACYEIGVCVSIPVVTYIGGRGHKPLWIGWGMFIMGAGSIVFSLPHFIASSYVIPNIDASVCNTTIRCDADDLRSMQAFFILGQILVGIGASPVYTIALNYLDENVKEVYSSTYHGIYFASALLGPGAGFLIGGYLLSVFVDFSKDVDITNESIFWVGNWWIAFLVMGALFIVFSMPVLMYPKQLPFTDEVRHGREKEMQNQRDALAIRGDEKFGTRLHDFPRCLLIALKNPILIFISLSGAMDTGLASAFSAFGTKYIETMFSLPSATAALYYGATVVAFACSGNILSGVLVTKFNMTVPQMIKFSVVATACSLCCVFVFMIHCPTPDVAGVNVPYSGETQATCNSKCSGCSTHIFNPVCGSDGLTYTSFCDAGCVEGDVAESFVNCSRIEVDATDSLNGNSSAVNGKCNVDGCPSLSIFLIFGGLTVFFGYLKSQSGLQISLRSIPFYQRPFALGVQWLIMRVVGQIPLPIILGKILDLSCIVWGEECGQCGACNMYDGPSMARSLTSLGAVVKFLSLVCLLLTWRVYKPVTHHTSPDENTASMPKRRNPPSVSGSHLANVAYVGTNNVS